MRRPFLLGGKCHRFPARSGWLMLIAVSAAAFLTTGCASPNDATLIDEVVPFVDQQAAILEVVPLGTTRDVAAARLEKAGIKYSDSGGPEPSIFYCESWEMEPGEQYLLFSEMLFDEQGRLEDIRMTPNSFAQ